MSLSDKNYFPLLLVALMWLLYFAILAGAIGSANAHSWYENACCSDKDCAPVDDGNVTETKDGVLVKGFGILSETDPRLRWSQDERDHICAQRTSSFGMPITPKLMCVYRKRKFM